MALTINGMVMNGPTPIMSIMFRAVALETPMPRIRVWGAWLVVPAASSVGCRWSLARSMGFTVDRVTD